MSKKLFLSTILSGCLILVMAFNLTWAVQSFSVSQIIKKNGIDKLTIVKDGNDWIACAIEGISLDGYMTEQGITEVAVTAEITEEVVTDTDGSQHYVLDFTFGPSGAYFTPPLLLVLSGKYVSPSTQVWLFNEQGEALEGTRHAHADRLEFEIPHFSNYYYDHYYP